MSDGASSDWLGGEWVSSDWLERDRLGGDWVLSGRAVSSLWGEPSRFCGEEGSDGRGASSTTSWGDESSVAGGSRGVGEGLVCRDAGLFSGGDPSTGGLGLPSELVMGSGVSLAAGAAVSGAPRRLISNVVPEKRSGERSGVLVAGLLPKEDVSAISSPP